MSIRRQDGVTLIEMIIAIAIIGVGLAGVMGALSRTTVFSAHPMVTKQLGAIAEGMMEEVLLQPFSANANVGTRNNSCARNTFNDMLDYNGYNSSTICDIDGSTAPGLSGYSVAVTVGTAGAGIGGVPKDDIMVVNVTVSSAGQSYTLTGWRSNYTKVAP